MTPPIYFTEDEDEDLFVASDDTKSQVVNSTGKENAESKKPKQPLSRTHVDDKSIISGASIIEMKNEKSRTNGRDAVPRTNLQEIVPDDVVNTTTSTATTTKRGGVHRSVGNDTIRSVTKNDQLKDIANVSSIAASSRTFERSLMVEDEDDALNSTTQSGRSNAKEEIGQKPSSMHRRKKGVAKPIPKKQKRKRTYSSDENVSSEDETDEDIIPRKSKSEMRPLTSKPHNQQPSVVQSNDPETRYHGRQIHRIISKGTYKVKGGALGERRLFYQVKWWEEKETTMETVEAIRMIDRFEASWRSFEQEIEKHEAEWDRAYAAHPTKKSKYGQ